MEGLMGEYAGYLWSGPGQLRPVYHVTAVSYRNDPILPVVAAGEPVEEDHTVQGITSTAEAVTLLRQAGIPTTMAWTTLESANHWLVVTLPLDWKERTGLTRNALFQKMGETIFAFKFGRGIPKVIVLNDDIDASNTREVVWGFATRVRPHTGEHFFDHEKQGPMNAFITLGDDFISVETPRVIYDGLVPDEWGEQLPQRSSFAHSYPKALQQYVLDNWEAYGYRV